MLGLTEQVELVGALNHAELVPWLMKAWLVVTPSRPSFPEGRCMSAMEALAFGKPVVAPDYGPFPYLIKHEQNGLLFKAGDGRALQAALQRLSDDSQLYDELVIGAIQGFYGGWIDLLGQRLIEIWSSMPSLYVLIIVSASIGLQGFNFTTLATLLLILLAFSWTGSVGAVRAEVLRTRKMDYVQAARVMGMSEKRIMFRHVLPNALVATITFLPFSVAGAVTALTSLDFLGFGLPPGSPSLGELMLQGKNNPDAVWLWLTSFVTLMLLLSLLMFIGEAVRDAFDPRKTLGKGA